MCKKLVHVFIIILIVKIQNRRTKLKSCKLQYPGKKFLNHKFESWSGAMAVSSNLSVECFH